MKWTKEAEEAVSKVPFFVRKRVRKRVEEEAGRNGAGEVTRTHVTACKKRFLDRMEEEVKGYQVEACFGPAGCPNRAVTWEIVKTAENLLARRNWKDFLKGKVNGPLKMHHEFRVSISDCPNACSRPQIADLGLIGARRPGVSGEACIQCGACVQACREQAVSLPEGEPVLDVSRCLSCGQCLPVCPTGTLREEETGYRLLVGGKLGRHPRLALELKGIRSFEATLRAVEGCLDYYQGHCLQGERFGEILERTGIDALKKLIS